MINLFSVVWVELRDSDKQRAVALAVNRALAGLGEESQFNVGVREARPGAARQERGGWEIVLEGPALPACPGWRLTRVDGHPSVFYRRRLHGPDEENAAYIEETIERLVLPLKPPSAAPPSVFDASRRDRRQNSDEGSARGAEDASRRDRRQNSDEGSARGAEDTSSAVH